MDGFRDFPSDFEPSSASETAAAFSLVPNRRAGDGGQEPVAVIDDPALVERAIRRAAG